MSKSNRQILEENNAAVLKFAKQVDIRPTPVVDFRDTRKSAVDAVSSINLDGEQGAIDKALSSAIKKLDQAKDNRLGIVWQESEDLGNGTRALVRDARNQTKDPALLRMDAPEKYGMQLLSEVRGAMDLVDKSDLSPEAKKEAKRKLMFVANTALADVDNLGPKTIKDYNSQLVYVLESSGIADAGDKLKFASEIGGFKDEHQHITTLSTAVDAQGKKHTVVEAEVMLNGLTDKQKAEYTTIAQSKKGDKLDIPWFDNMSPYKQDVLRGVAADIATGKKVMPTQLLSDLPGIKNAYQKVTAVISEGMEKPKVLSETLHCGTPATKIKSVDKDGQQAIVDENVRQLQSFAKPGEKLNLNILTSETPGNVRGEDFVAKQLEKTQSQNPDVAVSKSPINRWRIFGGGRDTEQFEKDLAIVGKTIEGQEGLKNLGQYLQKGRSSIFDGLRETFGFETTRSKAAKELQALAQTNPDLAKDLKAAFETRNLADSTTWFAPSENVNLEMTAKMAIVRHAVKHEEGSLHNFMTVEERNAFSEVVDFCKSGKDRTGYEKTTETRLAVAQYLGIDPNSELGQKNFQAQVAAGHTQEMAGVQGGTTGCHGIKTNPEFGVNRSDNAVNGILDQESSHFNSKIKQSKKPEKVAEKFEMAYLESQSRPRSQTIVPETRPRSKEVSIHLDQPAKEQSTERRHSVPPKLQEQAHAVGGTTQTRPRSKSVPPPPPKKDVGLHH